VVTSKLPVVAVSREPDVLDLVNIPDGSLRPSLTRPYTWIKH